jgi:hypothetical protein
MANYSSGITAILARMDTNPAEFFGDAGKWGFIFKDRFREVLTEPEKGALHEKLKEVRRQEFDHMVMRTMLDDEMQGKWATGVLTSADMQSRYRNTEQNQSVLQNSSGRILESLGSSFK